MPDSGLKPHWRGWRPVDIDEAFLKDIAKRIKSGLAPELAAESFGIPKGVFRRWMREGEEQVSQAIETGEVHHAHHREAFLWLACKQAAGALAEELAGNVKAGHEASQGHRWLLERLQREDYGSTEKVDIDVTVEGGAPIALEGRAVVGLADVVRLALETGQGHLLGLGDAAGDPRPSLPAAGDVLPDSPEGEPAAGALSAD